MPRSPSSRPNDVELAILRVIWSRETCTVREVHDALRAERDYRLHQHPQDDAGDV